MKRFVAASALVLLLVPVAGAQEMMEPQTVKGTIIDTACYAAGKHGPEEVGCTEMCLQMGVPASFLTESGEVLVLLPPADDMAGMRAFEGLKEHAAKQVEITGTIMNRDGLKTMMVKEVKAN